MSDPHQYTIQCPNCQTEQRVELVDTIHANDQPELRAAYMQNELNKITCAGCPNQFVVEKNLFYQDREHMLLVFYMPCSVAELQQVEEAFAEHNRNLTRMLPDDIEAPEIQLVIERQELTERIFLAEEGMNHRIIEYIKYQMYLQNTQRLDPFKQTLLFNAQDSTEDILFFLIRNIGTGQFEGALEYGRDAYEALRGTLEENDDQATQLLELFPGPYVSARVMVMDEERE